VSKTVINDGKNKKTDIDDIFDTSEGLTERDYQDIEDIKDIKRTLLSFINIDVLIEEIKHLIDDNVYINFKNERSKKFIDKRRPIFNIKIDSDLVKKSKEYKKSSFSNEEDEVKYYSNIVFNELTRHITEFIRSAINDDDEIKDYIYSKQLFGELDETDRKQLNDIAIISMMFAAKYSKDDKSTVAYELLI
jgi:hypothetical protein